jgi:hypothetical protein
MYSINKIKLIILLVCYVCVSLSVKIDTITWDLEKERTHLGKVQPSQSNYSRKHIHIFTMYN